MVEAAGVEPAPPQKR